MTRNYSTSPFLRLPPEVRVRIYGLVLGGKQLWITHSRSRIEWKEPAKHVRLRGTQPRAKRQYFHQWGFFYHIMADPFHSANSINGALNLGLLHVCRHIYMETALLPYTLNTFTFKDDSVRRLFEHSARPGKKRVQKKAVGNFEIADGSEFCLRHSAG